MTRDPWVGYSRRGCLVGNRDLHVVRWRSHLILQDPVPPHFTKGTCVLTAEGGEKRLLPRRFCAMQGHMSAPVSLGRSLSISESAPELFFPKPQLPRT